MLAFSAGRLTSVVKFLLPLEGPDGDEVEFGRQLYFSLRDLEDEGISQCSIKTKSGEVPEVSFKHAELLCGKT